MSYLYSDHQRALAGPEAGPQTPQPAAPNEPRRLEGK